MLIELDRHRAEYHNDLLTIVPDVLNPDAAGSIARRTLDLIERGGAIHRDQIGTGDTAVLDGGGAYRHWVVDGLRVLEHFPDLMAIYEALKSLVSAVTLQDVTTSTEKFPRSCVNLKVYRGEGSEQGWHFDTNAITGLLYLTTNTKGGTRCEIPRYHPDEALRTTETRVIQPFAGSLLIMQGRRVWHRADPVDDEVKIVAPLNYYTATDYWRPEGIDNLVYGLAAK
jgi:hypothetical protein